MDALQRKLEETAKSLDSAVSSLSRDLLEMDSSRSRCARLARRHEDFADRVAADYPSLAGPARRIAELYRELDTALARMSRGAEGVIAEGGRTADRLRATTP